jgi:hypothetical protein
MRSQLGIPKYDEGRNAWPSTAVRDSELLAVRAPGGSRWRLVWAS